MGLIYLHSMPSNSFSWSWYCWIAVVRLEVLSLPLSMVIIQVFAREFGFGTFTSCTVSLKIPWPLSPPSLTHNSFSGRALLCQVSFPDLQARRYNLWNGYDPIYNSNSYLSLCVSRSAILRTMFGTYAKGNSLMTSPPPSPETRNGAFSTSILSPIILRARDRWSFSEARWTLNVFNHLKELCKFRALI